MSLPLHLSGETNHSENSTKMKIEGKVAFINRLCQE